MDKGILGLLEMKQLSIYKNLITIFGDYVSRFPATGVDQMLDDLLSSGVKVIPSDAQAQLILASLLCNENIPKSVQEIMNFRFGDLSYEVRPIYRSGRRHRTAFWNVDGEVHDRVRGLIFPVGGKGFWCDPEGKKVSLMDKPEVNVSERILEKDEFKFKFCPYCGAEIEMEGDNPPKECLQCGADLQTKRAEEFEPGREVDDKELEQTAVERRVLNNLKESKINEIEFTARGIWMEDGHPPYCYYYNESIDKLVRITWGQKGYEVFPGIDSEEGREGVSMLNDKLGLTDEEVEAMVAGSMFGWDIPIVTKVFGDIKEKGSKVSEQGEPEYSVPAKGIADKSEAERIARDKKGTVIQDEEDPKKFMVIVREDNKRREELDSEFRDEMGGSKVNESEDWDLTFKYTHNMLTSNPIIDRDGKSFHTHKLSTRLNGQKVRVFNDYQKAWVERNKGVPVQAKLEPSISEKKSFDRTLNNILEKKLINV